MDQECDLSDQMSLMRSGRDSYLKTVDDLILVYWTHFIRKWLAWDDVCGGILDMVQKEALIHLPTRKEVVMLVANTWQ